MSEDGKFVACYLPEVGGGGAWGTGRKISQVLLYPSQIPHWLAWNRALSSTMKARDSPFGSWKGRCSRLHLKCDGTRAETRFRLSAKRTSPFKSAGASVQSTTGSRDVRISGSNAGYTMFRGSLKSTGYPLHSPVSPPVLHRVPSYFNWTIPQELCSVSRNCDQSLGTITCLKITDNFCRILLKA
jgi:hypothetical protein